jgi:hypothetical protein
MTLAMSLISSPFVLQVSDRLVSRQLSYQDGTKRYRPYDVLANKSIVFLAKDALVSISYSGTAFIRGIPSDVWLARALHPPLETKPRFAFQAGDDYRPESLYTAIARVGETLITDFNGMPLERREQGLNLEIVGYRWSPKQRIEIPFAWHLTHSGDLSQKGQWERYSRYWGWESGGYSLCAIGDRATKPHLEASRRVDERKVFNENDAEADLVEVIRTASRQSKGTIGPDCISIVFGRYSDAIRIRYLPHKAQKKTYDIYTPWIIMPGRGVVAPSVLVNRLAKLHLSGVSVTLERETDTPDDNGPTSFSSQNRPSY